MERPETRRVADGADPEEEGRARRDERASDDGVQNGNLIHDVPREEQPSKETTGDGEGDVHALRKIVDEHGRHRAQTVSARDAQTETEEIEHLDV